MTLVPRTRRDATRAVWVAVSLWAGVAVADEAAAAPGDHVRVGDVATITPSVGVGVEAQYNPYRDEDAVVPFALDFLLVPTLDVEVRHRKVHFDFDGRYELRKYFDPEIADDLDRFSDFNLGADLRVAPEAVVGFDVRNRAVLINRAVDQAFRDNSLLTQFHNDLSLRLPIRPGEELTIAPGFRWSVQDVRIPGLVGTDPFNTRQTIAPGLDVEWRFFPKTAFVVDAVYERHHWRENVVPSNEPASGDPNGGFSYGDYVTLADSQHFKGMLGLRGRITRVLLLEVLGGYGFGFYDESSVIDEAPADAAGELDPVANGFGKDVSLTDAILVTARPTLDFGYGGERPFGQRLFVQYKKDFQPSFFTNYVHQHAVLAGYDGRFGRHVRLHAGGGVRFERYVGEVERSDVYGTADLYVDLLPTRFLVLRVGGRYDHRTSDEPTVEFDAFTGSVVFSFVY